MEALFWGRPADGTLRKKHTGQLLCNMVLQEESLYEAISFQFRIYP